MMTPKTLGIYIHIPFCASKCGYCDFYSCAGKESSMQAYQDALLTHIEESIPQMQQYFIDTVYIGGGTPSHYGAEYLCEIIRTIKHSGRLLRDAEITVEMNPDSMMLNDLRMLYKEGVNRISMGVQSANDEVLQTIGRRHTYAQAFKAYKTARQAGFKNISVDLMYGLPGQTKDDWADTLSKIIRWKPSHISCYGLKLEEGTPMYEVYHDTPAIPDDDCQADMYSYAAEYLERFGYKRYEISNFSRKGFESMHNIRYWKHEDYMGFGPGAHSFVDGLRYSYIRDLKGYIDGVMKGGVIVDESEKIEGLEIANEYIMLRLRMAEGIDPVDYTKRFRADFGPLEEKLRFFATKGWTERNEQGCWSFTTSGFLISNLLLNELLDVQAAQNAIGVPYILDILEQREREELPLSDEELFMQAMRGF